MVGLIAQRIVREHHLVDERGVDVCSPAVMDASRKVLLMPRKLSFMWPERSRRHKRPKISHVSKSL